MDTVTEARSPSRMAQEGGLGIVHKNMTPTRAGGGSGEGQALRERRRQGSDHDPAEMTVRDVLALTQQHRISGLPVVEGKRVVGIVTNRDLRFETNLDQPVRAS